MKPSHALAACALGLVAVACPAACAPSAPDSSTSSTGEGFGGSATTTASANGAGGADAGNDVNDLLGDTSISDVLNSDTACASVTKQATSTPLDLFLLLDKSSSMVGDKWNGAQVGIGAFVNDTASAGVIVGLKFFPRTPDATPACDQFAYKVADVPFAALPMNAKPITDAIAAQTPNGFDTPTYPALGGAILEDIDLLTQSPSHRAAVLLVTDGQPQGPAAMCGNVDPQDPAVIAALAAAGASQAHPVLTYVIGLPGVDQAFANQVALAGGTTSAILIDNADVQGEFEAALAKVRGEALPCQYLLPDEVTQGAYDPTQVNVLYTPGSLDGGAPSAVVFPEDQNCSGMGWKYDVPSKPTEILLCPASCALVKQDDLGKIDVLLGCPTQIAK